jgi:ubiquitin carboxyl-terminal hydrolase 34
VRLPADDVVLELLDSSSTSYKDVFPPGQPFKSLYALHAIRDYIAGVRRFDDTERSAAGSASIRTLAVALKRTMSFIVAGIQDNDVTDRNSSKQVEMTLILHFVKCYTRLLSGT